MYNLLVSGNAEAWRGEPWRIERSRCVNEYTDDAIRETYGALSATQVDELRRLPCIFAYESRNEIDPHFGLIRNVRARPDKVQIEYELHDVSVFLTAEQLEEMMFELDIGEWELNRTHWAVKDVDLAAELSRKGIILPRWASRAGPKINLANHNFDVALSFPGEVREYVEQVAQHLERLLGPNRYFYDRNYTAQLARPSLDTFLQGIYQERSRLVVVFAGGDYQVKDWCGIEFRAIRKIINAREHDRVMFVRMDDGEVEGIFGHDGYVDARAHEPSEIAAFIEERVGILDA